LHLAKKMVHWIHSLKYLSGACRTDTCSALVEAVLAFDEDSVKLRGMVGEMAKVQDSGHALDGLD
jgi:hypothetical protein